MYRCLLLSLVLVSISPTIAQNKIIPLLKAHAHNDYYQKRPLLDALDRGFCSVEVDIFLIKGELLVGHYIHELDPRWTLESIYLSPLRKHIKKNDGYVYDKNSPFTLLIDIKTDGKKTYEILRQKLEQYSDILSTFSKGKWEDKAVTAIISGNRAWKEIAADPIRYAGVDGRLSDLGKKKAPYLMPLISDNWNKHFRWYGIGAMPDHERKKLQEFVEKAHKQDARLRFWATPENPNVWRELLAAGVDLIGTDDLKHLQTFLLAQKKHAFIE